MLVDLDVSILNELEDEAVTLAGQRVHVPWNVGEHSPDTFIFQVLNNAYCRGLTQSLASPWLSRFFAVE